MCVKVKYFYHLFLGLLYAYTVNGQDSKYLEFNQAGYKTETISFKNKTFKIRAFEGIIYVNRPVDPTLQCLNIYIPEEYYMGDSINGYSSETAPILLPVILDNYISHKPLNINPNEQQPIMPNTGIDRVITGKSEKNQQETGSPGLNSITNELNLILAALSDGYIVVSAGLRGVNAKNSNGDYIGKAPACIVDLKATVRYLKHNDKLLPGSAGKIIAYGYGAGGGIAILLGMSGNNAFYQPYLNTIGAADATDDIFAVTANGPVTNIENADLAYEWQFNGIETFKNHQAAKEMAIKRNLTPKERNISKQAVIRFGEYLTRLKLRDENGGLLMVDTNGNGNFRELIKSYYLSSAQVAIKQGVDLSKYPFFVIKKQNIASFNFEAYLNYLGRFKPPLVFDAINCSSPENSLFGSTNTDKRHFSSIGINNSTVKATLANQQVVRIMNPLAYLYGNNADIAKHWRLSVDYNDNTSPVANTVILAVKLKNSGFNTDFKVLWETNQSTDFATEELLKWMKSVTK